MRRKSLAVVTAALVALATSAVPAVAATKNVKVADNFFSPAKLTVKPKTTIKWKWSNVNADSHDVFLNKGPSGVKKFHSAPAATFFSFKRTLKKTGRYKFVCTLHEEMRMTITVRR